MQVEIITPEQTLYKGEAEAIGFPGTSGSFTVLKNHAPLVSSLQKGKIKVRNGKEEQFFEVKSGFVEVLNNKVIALV